MEPPGISGTGFTMVRMSFLPPNQQSQSLTDPNQWLGLIFSSSTTVFLIKEHCSLYASSLGTIAIMNDNV